jgi:acyl-CoA synthetase (AMP-forming)/AMP-acid ligase II
VNIDRLFAPYKPTTTHLVDSLEYWTREKPDHLAFTFLKDGEQDEVLVTYKDLHDAARAIAVQLAQYDIKGERVLLLYGPGLDFLKGFLGCLYAGAIAVPAYPPRRNRSMNRIESISDDAKPKVVLASFNILQVRQAILKV